MEFNPDTAFKILKEIKDLLQGVPWWLDYGVLLGAHRDGDFTPSEHDIDIAIPSDVLKNYPLIRQKFINAGFSVHVCSFADTYALCCHKDGIEVDVNPVEIAFGFAWKSLWKTVRRTKKMFWASYPKQCFLGTDKVQLRGVDFPAPKDIEKYLTLLYGNWQVRNDDWQYENTGYLALEAIKKNYFNMVD